MELIDLFNGKWSYKVKPVKNFKYIAKFNGYVVYLHLNNRIYLPTIFLPTLFVVKEIENKNIEINLIKSKSNVILTDKPDK